MIVCLDLAVSVDVGIKSKEDMVGLCGQDGRIQLASDQALYCDDLVRSTDAAVTFKPDGFKMDVGIPIEG